MAMMNTFKMIFFYDISTSASFPFVKEKHRTAKALQRSSHTSK
jgi:hypothetical protein